MANESVQMKNARLLKQNMENKSQGETDDFLALNQALFADKFKTEMCVKFQQLGACPYGKRCNFAHGEDELRGLSRHPLYKTRPCIPFIQTGKCPYGRRCNFIHSVGDTRNQNKEPAMDFKPKKYKTRPCVIFAKGAECPYGDRCNFIHDRNDPRNLEVVEQAKQLKITGNGRLRFQPVRPGKHKWNTPLTGVKHQSGCWNATQIFCFEKQRDKLSQGYLNFKNALGTGPLPETVLLLKDNKQYVDSLIQKRTKELLSGADTRLQFSKREDSSSPKKNIVKQEKYTKESSPSRSRSRSKSRSRSDSGSRDRSYSR